LNHRNGIRRRLKTNHTIKQLGIYTPLEDKNEKNNSKTYFIPEM
jgi:hypothetical protein